MVFILVAEILFLSKFKQFDLYRQINLMIGLCNRLNFNNWGQCFVTI